MNSTLNEAIVRVLREQTSPKLSEIEDVVKHVINLPVYKVADFLSSDKAVEFVYKREIKGAFIRKLERALREAGIPVREVVHDSAVEGGYETLGDMIIVYIK